MVMLPLQPRIAHAVACTASAEGADVNQALPLCLSCACPSVHDAWLQWMNGVCGRSCALDGVARRLASAELMNPCDQPLLAKKGVPFIE